MKIYCGIQSHRHQELSLVFTCRLLTTMSVACKLKCKSICTSDQNANQITIITFDNFSCFFVVVAFFMLKLCHKNRFNWPCCLSLLCNSHLHGSKSSTYSFEVLGIQRLVAFDRYITMYVVVWEACHNVNEPQRTPYCMLKQIHTSVLTGYPAVLDKRHTSRLWDSRASNSLKFSFIPRAINFPPHDLVSLVCFCASHLFNMS